MSSPCRHYENSLTTRRRSSPVLWSYRGRTLEPVLKLSWRQPTGDLVYLVRKVQAVRGSLQYSHREIGGVKSLSQELEQRINGIESQITRLRADINVDLTRDDQSDNHSRTSFSSDNRSLSSLSIHSDNDSNTYDYDYQDDYESEYQSDNQSDQSRDDSDVEEESHIWQLPVKGPDGSTIFIRIHKDATVDEVISQVSKRKSIPMEHLHVLYTIKQLEYGQGKHLSDYGIQDMFTLHYVVRIGGPPPDRQTCSTPPDRQTCSTPPDRQTCSTPPDKQTCSTPPDRQTCSTPQDRQTCPTPPDRQTCSTPQDRQTCSSPHEEQLQDEETTGDSGTEEGSNIWQLSAKLNDRITHCIKIHKDAPVDKLIRKISERNQIPIESQSIVYTTKRLEYGQGKHLSDYGIIDKSTMFVVLLVAGPSSGSHTSTPQVKVKVEPADDYDVDSNIWQLSVLHLSGRKDYVAIHKNATVDELMEKISEKTGIPTAQIRHIMHKGQKLYQGRRLSDYSVQNNSTLFLALRLGASPHPKPT